MTVSSWLACRLAAVFHLPKGVGMIPCNSKDGVSTACTMTYWSPASFLASVIDDDALFGSRRKTHVEYGKIL